MGKLLAASAALIVASIAPLPAEEMPWCVELDVFTKNCAFAHYSDCAQIAGNAGAACIRNPNYRPPAAAKAKASPSPAAKKPH